MAGGKDRTENGKARRKFLRLLDRERPSPEVIGAFSGDRALSPAEKKAMNRFRRQTGDRFYAELLFTLTHTYHPYKEAKRIWEEVLEHKACLTRQLNRNPGLALAALDFPSNIRKAVEEPAVIAASEISSIAEVALRDGLTGLLDHAAFYAKLQLETDRYRRYRSPVSLIMADIDDFKEYNDRHGHQAGDRILVKISRVLEETTRDLDICARYGGEEFAVILPQTGRRRALGTAERIRRGVEEKFRDDYGVTVSLGVATCPLDADDVDSLVSTADENLYKSKKAGKNRVLPAK